MDKRICLSIILLLSTPSINAMQSSNKQVYFIVGPAGSGKTTVADAVRSKHRDSIEHYSVGNLLRAEGQKDTERGRLIKQIVDNAQIVPLEIGMDVVSRAIQESSKGIILFDGFPPTFEYAIAFDNLTKNDSSIKLLGALEIFVDQQVAEDRVLKRNRTDDVRAIFEMRYQRYRKNAEILNAWYKKFYTFTSIDGNQPLDNVVKCIEAQIDCN
jgi:adenylate kinase